MSSRHEQPAQRPGFTVAFGWDNPMGTFFFQVMSEEEEVVLWLGDSPTSIADPAQMVSLVRDWFDLSSDRQDQLRQDRQVDINRAPTALQKHGLALVAASAAPQIDRRR